MILLLFGPPGSGKGTQSRLITSWLGIPGISTGDMLRAEIQAGTDLGRVAQSIMASGGLVGDDLVNQMLEKRVSQPDAGRGFLLDGYPRTVEQATFLDRLIERRRWPKPVILHLDVPLDALLGRLTARRQCPKCGTIYNLQYQPPKTPGICDLDGTSLITRTDDEKDVVADRLRTYTTLSRPVRRITRTLIITKSAAMPRPTVSSRRSPVFWNRESRRTALVPPSTSSPLPVLLPTDTARTLRIGKTR